MGAFYSRRLILIICCIFCTIFYYIIRCEKLATKFDPKDYARQRLSTLCTKYFPKECININAGRKGFRIGDSMNHLIKESRNVIKEAQNKKWVVPDSTANFFRYGVLLQDIFQELSSYQITSSIKTRSRRGYRKELEVVDFDLKKIELAFKKSSLPPIKTQKDDKLLKAIKKVYFDLLNEYRYHDLYKDVIEKQSLFIVPDSEGNKFYSSFTRISENLMNTFQEKKNLEKENDKLQDEYDKTSESVIVSSQDMPQFRKEIEQIRKKSGFQALINEKEKLISDGNLSLFLKVLTTSLERYLKMMERKESVVLDQKDEFLGLILDPIRFKGLNEDLWKQIVFIIETHGMELCGGKNWFKFNNSTELREFIVRKEILEKFAGLRKLETDLEDLEIKMQKDLHYKDIYEKILKVENQKKLLKELEKEKVQLNEKISNIVLEIEKETEKALNLLN